MCARLLQIGLVSFVGMPAQRPQRPLQVGPLLSLKLALCQQSQRGNMVRPLGEHLLQVDLGLHGATLDMADLCQELSRAVALHARVGTGEADSLRKAQELLEAN